MAGGLAAPRLLGLVLPASVPLVSPPPPPSVAGVQLRGLSCGAAAAGRRAQPAVCLSLLAAVGSAVLPLTLGRRGPRAAGRSLAALAWGSRPAAAALLPRRNLVSRSSAAAPSAAGAVRRYGSSSSSSAFPHGERPAIVLHHGFFGGKRVAGLKQFSVEYFRGIPASLRDLGYDVLVSEVPPTAATEVRAAALAEQITAWPELAGRKVVILAHSMGGLDARYAVSKFGLGSSVDTLLTIATPHRGSPVADSILGLCDMAGVSSFLQALPMKLLSEMPDGGRCLTVQASEEFNALVQDDAEVRYLSVGGDRGSPTRMSPEMVPTYLFLKQREGANDGLVSVRSSSWGTYLETLDMDHLHQLNFPLPHRWFTGAPTYDDVVQTYRRLALIATTPPEQPCRAPRAAPSGPS